MFGIGLPELILIMGLALIVVGPDKLPGLAKTVAKQILELKKAANSLKDSLDEELKEEKETLREIAAPLNELDVRLPDFDEMHGNKKDDDLPNHVVDAVASPNVDATVSLDGSQDAKGEVVVEPEVVAQEETEVVEEQKS